MSFLYDKPFSLDGGGVVAIWATATPLFDRPCTWSTQRLAWWDWQPYMWPSPRAALRTTQELVDHYGLAATVWEGIQQAIGAIGADIRPLASIPPAVLAAAVEEARTAEGSTLTIMEASQVGLVYRAARRELYLRDGGDPALWTAWSSSDTARRQDQQGATTGLREAPTAGAPGEKKMKYTNILDQTDESEFTLVEEATRAKWIQKYLDTVGGLPDEVEEPTMEQLSALHRRLAGGGPYPFQPEAAEGHEVQDVDPRRQRRLHGEGDPGACEPPAMAVLLPGLSHSHDHAGDHQPRASTGLRRFDGAVEQPLPYLLAPVDLGGREGTVRASGPAEAQGDDGYELGGTSAPRMGVRPSLKLLVQDVGGRPGLLAGASPHAGDSVDLSRGEGRPQDSSRAPGSQLLRGRRAGHRHGLRDADEGDPGLHARERQAAEHQGQEGRQEEEASRGQGRTSSAQGATRWRRRHVITQRERRRERRERQRRRRAAMLRLEQQQRILCGLGSGAGMQSQRQAGAQVHGLQESRPPFAELPEGQGVLSWTQVPWIWELAKGKRKREGAGLQGDGSPDDDPIEDFGSPGDDGAGGGEGSGNQGRGDGGQRRDGSREDVRGKAASLGAYKGLRRFLFIHHFSGASGRLPNAIATLARAKELTVEVISVDRDAGGEDLTADEPYTGHLSLARAGLVDGYHSGFPCTTFSRVRWRKADFLPGPVRSKTYPHGLPTNSPQQQREADVGSVMLSRSLAMAKALREVGKERKVGPSYTLENPPASDHPQHLSAWETEDMIAFCDSEDIQEANFDSCVYEQRVLRDGKRHLKPQMFAGKLERLRSMSGRCTCESGQHVPVVGKKATAAAAMYSSELCVAYATRLVAHFEKMAESEFLEDRIAELGKEIVQKQRSEDASEIHQKVKKKLKKLKEEDLFKDEAEAEHLEKLRKRLGQSGAGEGSDAGASSSRDARGEPGAGGTEGSLEGTKAKSKAGPAKAEVMPQMWHHAGEEGDTDPNVSWKGGPGKYGLLKRSAAVEEQAFSQVYLGGMRHPARVVRDMPGALNVGLRVRAVWERLVRKAPALLKAAEEYGAGWGLRSGRAS